MRAYITYRITLTISLSIVLCWQEFFKT